MTKGNIPDQVRLGGEAGQVCICRLLAFGLNMAAAAVQGDGRGWGAPLGGRVGRKGSPGWWCQSPAPHPAHGGWWPRWSAPWHRLQPARSPASLRRFRLNPACLPFSTTCVSQKPSESEGLPVHETEMEPLARSSIQLHLWLQFNPQPLAARSSQRAGRWRVPFLGHGGAVKLELRIM